MNEPNQAQQELRITQHSVDDTQERLDASWGSKKRTKVIHTYRVPGTRYLYDKMPALFARCDRRLREAISSDGVGVYLCESIPITSCEKGLQQFSSTLNK